MSDQSAALHAITDLEGMYNDRPSAEWLRTLRAFGKDSGYTWGFRTYRTVFTEGSDAAFARGMEILSAYMRHACFSTVLRRPNIPRDDTPTKELWSRMRNEVVENPALEDAFVTVVHENFLAWLESQGFKSPRGRAMEEDTGPFSSSPSHRFFVIIDANAL